MADLADVEAALVGVLSAALQPGGPGDTSVVGAPCRIYRGWPVASALDADLQAGVINVSVFSVPGSARNTTRWDIEDTSAAVAPTLSVRVVGGISAVFGGSAVAGQVAGLLAGTTTYVYRTQAGDTPGTVAASLAQAARADQPAWSSETVVTLPQAGSILARVVADGSVLQEVRRQEQTLRVSLWCPTPASRDVAAAAADVAFAVQAFVTLPDGSVGRVRYAGTVVIDGQEDAQLFRRELLYVVEYPTVLVRSVPAMLFGELALTGTVVDATPTFPIVAVG